MFIVINVIILLVSPAEFASAAGRHRKTLVVSFDGFAKQYFTTHSLFLPWFSHFRQNGVFSNSIQSVFPSVTFPNYFSIVTGLYPESHGIVGNSMYEQKTGRLFTMNNTDLSWWGSGEPIWITIKRLHLPIKTAVSGWPGGDVVYRLPGNENETATADYVMPFDTKVSFQKRVDDIVQLMTVGGVDLAFLYHFQPDSTGHGKGIRGPLFSNELLRTDWQLSYVLLATERAGLSTDLLNLIICSDHGMTDIARLVYLDDYVNIASKISSFSQPGAFAAIWPQEPWQTDGIYLALKRAADKSGGIWNVYRKSRIPERFHFRKNDRIAPIVAIGSPGTYIALNRGDKIPYIGIHGYDPDHSEMRPIFMARGPAFHDFNGDYNASLSWGSGNNKSDGGNRSVIMETKDIYALIAELVGLHHDQLPANNASLSHFHAMLKGYTSQNKKKGLMPSKATLLLGSAAGNYHLFVHKLPLLISAILLFSILQSVT